MEYKRHQKLLAHYKAVLKDEPAFQARSLCCLSIRNDSRAPVCTLSLEERFYQNLLLNEAFWIDTNPGSETTLSQNIAIC